MGLQRVDDDAAPGAPALPSCYLWPENVAAWNLWQCVQTQWRWSMDAREGLDYTALCAYLHQVARIKPRKFQVVFGTLQVMERAALDVWAEQRRQRQ